MAAIAAAPAAALCVGPQAAVCGAVALAVLVIGGGAYIYTQKADETADTDLDDADTDECTGNCPCESVVIISNSASPETAQHIADAQSSGYPSVLTIDRAGRNIRRREALRNIPILPGKHRDEYPPAVFLEGGFGASVRHISAADNLSSGGQMSAQMGHLPDGCKVTMIVGP